MNYVMEKEVKEMMA